MTLGADYKLSFIQRILQDFPSRRESLLEREERELRIVLKNQLKEKECLAGPHRNFSYIDKRATKARRNLLEIQSALRGDHSKDQWDAILEACHWACLKCGFYIFPRPTKDHILPISMGGSNSIANLQPLCRECNSSNKFNHQDLRPMWIQDIMAIYFPPEKASSALKEAKLGLSPRVSQGDKSREDKTRKEYTVVERVSSAEKLDQLPEQKW